MHCEDFNNVLFDANVKYQSKKKVYGETWKTMNIISLNERLKEEFIEQQHAITSKEKYEELLDLINIALMMAERLRK